MSERWLTVLGPWGILNLPEPAGPTQWPQVRIDFPGVYQARDITENPGETLRGDPNSNLFWVRCDESLVPQIEAHPDYAIITDDPAP